MLGYVFISLGAVAFYTFLYYEQKNTALKFLFISLAFIHFISMFFIGVIDASVVYSYIGFANAIIYFILVLLYIIKVVINSIRVEEWQKELKSLE